MELVYTSITKPKALKDDKQKVDIEYFAISLPRRHRKAKPLSKYSSNNLI